MHGPKTVSGEWGIGKIEIKFKPKPPKKFPLGFTLFVFGSLLLIMQGMWRNAWLRSEVMIPVGAKIVGGLDWLRLPLPGRTVHSRGGLLDQGSIARDGAGRAVLMASSNTDVMFLQGYFHASERLFQMEISRRVASGTLGKYCSLLQHPNLLSNPQCFISFQPELMNTRLAQFVFNSPIQLNSWAKMH